LITERIDRWVVVTGGPGMGKSALLAQWLAGREAAGAPVPHHFIRRGVNDWDDPKKLAASLVAQIVALYPDHPEPEAAMPRCIRPSGCDPRSSACRSTNSSRTASAWSFGRRPRRVRSPGYFTLQ
jgi:hypothetical protein